MTEANFLTAGETARRLGLNRSTIGRWAKSGRIEAVRMPSGGYVIPVRDVERIEAERELERRAS